MSNIRKARDLGQSIWLDFISRKTLDSGELARLVDKDALGGVTSNPSIFEKAIGEGVEYGPALTKLRSADPKASAFELYEKLAVRDIQDACDVMRSVYDATKARDGYVSLEVTLYQGETVADIVREGVHLWQTVARPNVMIKVPATKNGILAFKKLIAQGINVNVTLLFAVETYAAVAEAYVAALEERAKAGGDLAKVASVASFFVSRIDSTIDKLLDDKLGAAKDDKTKAALKALQGKAAIANAKLAYVHFKQVFAGKRWEALAKKGAQSQRVLWASTGTKNKDYADTMYVDQLIGPDTVNTAPPATIDAFRDHGTPAATLEAGLEAAKQAMTALEASGVSLKVVTDKLLEEGLKTFSDAFVKLLKAVDQPQAKSGFAPFVFSAPKDIEAGVQRTLDDWTKSNKLAQLWKKDQRLWTNTDEAKWLGWLDAPTQGRAAAKELAAFAEEVKKDGITHVLLLGMGGSSLCPEVLKLTFGSKAGHPVLEVLDSTDPQQVAASAAKVDLAKTLFVVASKSGSTLEPNIFEQYFWDRAVKAVGASRVGARFVAITDPGSKLEGVAKQKGYRRIFAGVPEIGGRFSALSNFGLVPAALLGIDLERFLTRAEEMATLCGAASTPAKSPGVQLGALIGNAAKAGRDKLTFIVSPALRSLGAWLEQLIAESTGKNGKGVIPVDLESLAAPSAYGLDRIFVHVRLDGANDPIQDAAVDALERAGHPVGRILVADKHDLGAEFFRWEIATAVIGAVLGLNTFDQPDVEASKIKTKELTSAYEKSGALPAEKAFFEEDGILLFAPASHAQALFKATGDSARLADVLRAHLGGASSGDYVAILAYLEMSIAAQAELGDMRHGIRDALRVATCLGFGPRFLHSTGQAYKGGPDCGVILQITSSDAADLAVPGQKYTFGVVKAAQARGDFEVLVERGRRALRAHFTDPKTGLAVLRRAVNEALKKPAHATR